MNKVFQNNLLGFAQTKDGNAASLFLRAVRLFTNG